MPKVIDFGLAKATNQRLTERTVFTKQGLLIGTPAYMSPEQAEMTGLDVDTTTDIYSLGVVLYELLVGALPFDAKFLRAAGFDEMRRIIREDVPPTPSAKISTLSPSSKEIAHKRNTKPQTLHRSLKGELEWITMKAMEKDRTRRYVSAMAFALDVARHLDDQIVLARPPSISYRLGKVIRRNKRLATAALLTPPAVLLALFVGRSIFLSILHKQDLAQIHWTLDQSIELNTSPDQIQPDWERLLPIIKNKVREDPHGILATKARRAAVRAEVTVPAFGLLSASPPIIFGFYNSSEVATHFFDSKTDVIAVFDTQGALDGGRWVNTGWCGLLQGGSKMFSRDLQTYFPDQIDAGPHQLEFRAQLYLVDPEEISDKIKTCVTDKSFRDSIPELFLDESRQSESRSLGRFAVNLFHEYPNSFPQVVDSASLAGPVDSWFRLDRLRIYRLSLIGQAAPFVRFVWPTRNIELCYVAPSVELKAQNLVAGIELFGRFNWRMPVPIAARAHVRVGDSPASLLSFPLTFGSGKMTVSIGDGAMSWTTTPDGATPRITVDWAAFNTGDYKELPTGLPDGITPGVLHLVPSREVALQTQQFMTYLGNDLLLPIDIEIVTIKAYWQRDPCF